MLSWQKITSIRTEGSCRLLVRYLCRRRYTSLRHRCEAFRGAGKLPESTGWRRSAEQGRASDLCAACSSVHLRRHLGMERVTQPRIVTWDAADPQALRFVDRVTAVTLVDARDTETRRIAALELRKERQPKVGLRRRPVHRCVSARQSSICNTIASMRHAWQSDRRATRSGSCIASTT